MMGLVEAKVIEGKEQWSLTLEGRNVLDGIERGKVYDMTEDEIKVLQTLGEIEDEILCDSLRDK